MQKKLKRWLLIAAGLASVVVGIIGVVFPVLPTTPFLLLAAFCFVRSSERLNKWLLNNRLLGEYVRNYIEKRGMPLRLKIATILLLWISIGLSVTLGVHHIALRILLVFIAVAVTTHILLIKTTKKE